MASSDSGGGLPAGGALQGFSNAISGSTNPLINPLGAAAPTGVSVWGLFTGNTASKGYFAEVGRRVGITSIGVALAIIGFIFLISGSKTAQNVVSTAVGTAAKV